MRTVGSYEAKTHLPRLLQEVAQGEVIAITKNGKEVARLVPPEDDREARRRKFDEAWERWKRVREEHHITLGPDMTLADLMAESARERDAPIEATFDRMDERDRLRQQQDDRAPDSH
jgi:prevent-host-death family protein